MARQLLRYLRFLDVYKVYKGKGGFDPLPDPLFEKSHVKALVTSPGEDHEATGKVCFHRPARCMLGQCMLRCKHETECLCYSNVYPKLSKIHQHPIEHEFFSSFVSGAEMD